MSSEYILPISGQIARKLTRGWLWLGLAALLGSGIFSILLVLSRTPYISSMIPWIDFFHTAIVVHVDLSVLVWFLAFAGVLWSLGGSERYALLGKLALAVAGLSTALMALAPFIGDGKPLMSNYVPVLQHPIFLVGLTGFALGFSLLVVRSAIARISFGRSVSASAAMHIGLYACTISAVIAIIALLWSYLTIPAYVQGENYYELLFWGSGHVLQFTYTLLMLVSWLWLASASGVLIPLSPRVLAFLFVIGLAGVFFVPVIYLVAPVTTAEHTLMFTWLMQYAGSLAALPLSLALVYGIIDSGKAQSSHSAQRAALWMSMILFGVGGVIGFYIQSSNVTIPAHYHGSIVGVTLALMGVTYDLLPRLGFAMPHQRLAHIQPYLYGGGQLLHVIGLAWSGGYGVQRKVAGAAQGLDMIEKKIAMGLMGFGGLISIIGGFIFLVIVLRAMIVARAR